MNNLSPVTTGARNPQQGFVLVTALVLLIVLTVLGLASAQGTSLEERMAGNARDVNLAFQAAQAALTAGIGCVRSGAKLCASASTSRTGGNGVYIFAPPASSAQAVPRWNLPDFWTDTDNTISYEGYTDASLPQLKAQPQFIVEQLPPVAPQGASLSVEQYGPGASGVSRWRVTSYGVGGDTSASVMLQAVYSCCAPSGG